ncbi:membrane protein [Flavihumibacter solisilvae]|uniref:Membrane protein n=1 Tax=Flavihumibacter solisilvae TaxID=1349421 RepID=A0A0C1KZF1_9BACT|nr:membrane protein [Flavihumibacter solisilvae]
MSSKVTRATGNPITFIIAVLIIVAWAVAGPIFGFSDTWQLVINTGTTIITFLMVFVIQQSQNRDTIAIQLKLNELIACNAKASNRLIEIEELTDDELDQLKRFYARLVDLAQEETDIHRSHSIDEAQKSHKEKHP